MDGQYQERHDTTWPRRPTDRRQEGVVNEGGKGRHTLVNYNTFILMVM